MRTWSKGVVAVLALALSCSPLVAQGGPQDPPPGQQSGRDGFRSHGPMGPGKDRGRWGHGRGGFDRGGRSGGREFGYLRLLNDPAVRQQVGITDEQAAAIRTKVADFRKTKIRQRADLQVKRIDLRQLLAADKPDRAAINAKLQEISTSQLALEKSSVDFRLDMRDAITPAQREKIRQLMSERRGRGGPGRGGWGQPGQGRQGQRQRGQAPAPNPQGQPQPNPND